MKNEKELLNIDWDTFHKDTLELCKILKNEPPFSSILAVTRGGLIPSTIVAMELNIRKIDCVSIESYSKKNKGEHIIHKHSSLTDSRVLVVDDLSDSGDTLRYIKTQYPNAVYATVYAKFSGLDAVNFYYKNIKQNIWINFPWETY